MEQSKKKIVTLSLDEDVILWLKNDVTKLKPGQKYSNYVNSLLKEKMNTEKLRTLNIEGVTNETN